MTSQQKKVDLMEANGSQGVNNNLDKGKSTCSKNQEDVVANQNGMVETPNGYGVNMNSIGKATKVIMNSKLEVKLG